MVAGIIAAILQRPLSWALLADRSISHIGLLRNLAWLCNRLLIGVIGRLSKQRF
jgi:hypothetical protein